VREGWRWFGPEDPVSLDDVRQTGATEIVSSLQHIPPGELWSEAEIQKRKSLIEDGPEGRSDLFWTVVESVHPHDAIKLGLPEREQYTDVWIETMRNLAEAGIDTICYNFMPVIDWTRTDLDFLLPSGARSLRFDYTTFAAFDVYILKRDGAEQSYDAATLAKAKLKFDQMSPEECEQTISALTAGLPGASGGSDNLEKFRDQLALFGSIDEDQYRQNLKWFLQRVLPVAEELGVKLVIHPDDPPRALLGLQRIVSTADDLEWLFNELPSPSNGLALCVGTFGVRADNNLPEMARRFGDRIYFTHLRSTSRDADDPDSFMEAGHIDGDIDMFAVIRALLDAETDGRNIVFRPDHGHRMLGDLEQNITPGYSAIGRLRGLAEIRGVIKCFEWMENNPS
jgi:mannonate dehydratase